MEGKGKEGDHGQGEEGEEETGQKDQVSHGQEGDDGPGKEGEEDRAGNALLRLRRLGRWTRTGAPCRWGTQSHATP